MNRFVVLIISLNLLLPSVLFSAKQETLQKEIPGLTNFAKVSDGIYRGAQPTAEGFKELSKMGIKTIVNLKVFNSDKQLIKGLGFNYFHISFKAWHPEDEDVVKFLKIIANRSNYPIFIHCQHGSDRTGLMVAVYRIYVQGWTVDEAIKELPKYGFHVIWADIKRYLINFDKEKIKQELQKFKEPMPELVMIDDAVINSVRPKLRSAA